VDRFLVVAHLLGSLLMLFALLYAVPIVWSLHAADGMVGAFTGSFAGCLGAGLLIWAGTRRYRRELQPRDGALLVVLVWFVLSIAAAPPIIAARPDLTLIEAIFEAVSAITTTGATVISELETCPSRSISGVTCSSGWVAWASSCSRSRCCRFWVWAACSSSRPRRPAR
jgi:trk system potassium uptake protein TrkH